MANVINFPTRNSNSDNSNSYDGNLALKNEDLSSMGRVNQKPEYRQQDQVKNNGENLGPVGQENRWKKIQNNINKTKEDLKTKVSGHRKMAKQATRLATFAAYKFSWQYLLPTYGLTYLYLAFHFVAKYLMGAPGFCHFVSVTNPALAIKEIEDGKDTIHHPTMISFVVIGAIIIVLLTFTIVMITFIAYLMFDTVDALKLIFTEIKEIRKVIVGIMKDLVVSAWKKFFGGD